jgi:hypothetical protein
MRQMLKNLAICLTLVASLAGAAHAQQSGFVDAKGESSVYLNQGGGFARINATDKSIQLGFTRDTGREKPYFGIDFTGKAGNDFASLFSGGKPSPETEVGLTFGKRFFATKSPEESVKECINAKKTELLTTGLPKLIEEEKKRFVGNKTAEYLKKLTVEEGLKQKGPGSIYNSIHSELVQSARDRKLSPDVANDIADSLTPKLVEAELARKARENAEEEANSPGGAAAIKDTVIKDVETGGPASELCVLDPELLDAKAFDWISLRVAYKRARYKLLDETAAFANQVRKQNFDGYSATLAYNRVITLDDLSKAGLENAKGSKGSLIFGVSIGVERRNNSDDLNSVDLEDQSFTSSSGTTQRRAVSKQTVLSGEYKEFIGVPLNTDVVYFPGALNSRVAIDFFTRSDLATTGRKFVPGVGLFLTKEKSPTKVVGGISFSFEDGKPKVGLVGGFHF